MPNYFTIEAQFGDAFIGMGVNSDMIEGVVAGWNERLNRIETDNDIREHMRQLVVEGLMNERHKNDSEEAELISSALVWLTATGPYGAKLLPFMKQGDMTISYEITRLGPTTFNFRLGVDEKTKAALGPG